MLGDTRVRLFILFTYLTSFRSNKDSTVQYTFIEDYCLNDDDVSNGYLEEYGGGASLGFRLDSFKFVDYECAELFLHCEVSVSLKLC